MAQKMARALKLAIMAGGIRDLQFEDQWLVAMAMKIIEALPDKYDEVKVEHKEKGT